MCLETFLQSELTRSAKNQCDQSTPCLPRVIKKIQAKSDCRGSGKMLLEIHWPNKSFCKHFVPFYHVPGFANKLTFIFNPLNATTFISKLIQCKNTVYHKGPCKRTQQVPTTPNIVGCCWPTLLRPFAWA